MSEVKVSRKRKLFEFATSIQLWQGIIIGATIMMIATYLPLYPAIIDNWLNPITAEDCSYGLHQDFFGSRCIYHFEMQEILECEEFYLRDGYWWECK